MIDVLDETHNIPRIYHEVNPSTVLWTHILREFKLPVSYILGHVIDGSFDV